MDPTTITAMPPCHHRVAPHLSPPCAHEGEGARSTWERVGREERVEEREVSTRHPLGHVVEMDFGAMTEEVRERLRECF